MSPRPTLGIALCLLTLLLLARESGRGTFARAEEGWVKWLLVNSPGAIRDPEVTFVQIDDSQDRIFESWPLSPGDHTLVLQNLLKFEPQLVGIAPALRWEDGGVLFEALIAQLDAIPAAILGTELGFLEAEASFVDPTIAALFEPITGIVGDTANVPAVTTVLDLPQEEVRKGRPIGFTRIESGGNLLEGTDAKLRVPLLARYGETVIPGFVLRLAMAHLGAEAEDIEVSLGRWIRVGDRRIPIDAGGAMAVDPELRASVPRLNASALLLGADPDSMALSETEGRALRSLKTNAVVLGHDDPDSRVLELPGGERISHADLLTTALATIQGKRHVRRLEMPGRIVLWALALAAASSLFFLPRGRSVRVGLLALLGLAILGLLVFQVLQLWASPFIPLGVLLVGLFGAAGTEEGKAEEG